MNKHATLAIATAGALGAGGAEAALWNAQLVGAGSYSNSGLANFNLGSSTATFVYDDTSQLLAQAGGTFNARLTTSPNTTLFRQSITGLVIGNGGAASATTFVCTEGNFGGNVGASICGNYSFGANFINESIASWGPGTSLVRTLGGDDQSFGPPQSVAGYDGMATMNWLGTTLVLSNATCTGPCATQPAGSFNAGYLWTLQTSPGPVPPPGPGTAVIDFNAATANGSAPYVEDGYTLSLLSGHYDIWPGGFLGNSSAYLGLDVLPGELSSVMELTGGGTFDLLSLMAMFASTEDVLSVSSSAGGSASLTTAGEHTFTGPAWTNLDWVRLGSSAPIGGPGFDDIVLRTSVVPVPAAAWLFGSALVAAGLAQRRPGRQPEH